MERGDLNGGNVTITIAGEAVSVKKTDTVKETLKKLLEERGIDSFTILVDGDEIVNSNELPATFGDADVIEVQRYVKPGLR